MKYFRSQMTAHTRLQWFEHMVRLQENTPVTKALKDAERDIACRDDEEKSHG